MKIKLPGWTVTLLQSIFNMQKFDEFHDVLRQLPEQTTGREVANLLDDRKFRLIPKFPNHDLKHAVLEYKMEMGDEIRMQAYLVGNGNYTWPCLTFLALGVFRPKLWGELRHHYYQGKRSNSIHFLDLKDVMEIPLQEIRAEFGRNEKQCESSPSHFGE